MELIVGEDPLDELQGGVNALDECGNLSKIQNISPAKALNVYLQGAWTSATQPQ
jgi:hypothetical protein